MLKNGLKRGFVHPETGLVFWRISKGREVWIDKDKFSAWSENASRKMKEFSLNNKDALREKAKIYRKNNKDKINQGLRDYRVRNGEKVRKNEMNSYYRKREAIAARRKQSRILNRDKERERRRIARLSRLEEARIAARNYYRNKVKAGIPWFSEKQKLKNKEYRRLRLKRDPFFRFKARLRTGIFRAMKAGGWKKNSKTQEMLGCSFADLKLHLEKQFRDGMTWENNKFFGWHLDHIVPISSAKTEQDVIKLCHYTNLQPLWWHENLSKGDAMPEEIAQQQMQQQAAQGGVPQGMAPQMAAQPNAQIL